jgi:hypothetical protein
MKFGKFTAWAAAAGLLVCTAAWANPLPNGAGSKGDKAPKERHWTGTLVDVGCMAKTLGSQNMVPSSGPGFGVPHLMGWGAATPQKSLDYTPEGNVVPAAQVNYAQAGQQPGQSGQPGMGPSDRVPDPNAAAEARAARVNDAARTCAATPTTQTLGLATGEGQVLQFDHNGNVKAQSALKNADVEPGKKVKAKVTGTIQNGTTVMVASIELKGLPTKPRG